jgi:hypothetical protein
MPDETTRPSLRSIREIDELSREIVPLARDNPQALKDRLAALSTREQAELALRIPARERLELLLHAPKPMQLVRALPDAELYLTVREIGPHDSLPLLALSSASQITHLLDLESWRHDRFDGDRMGAWVALVLEAGDPVIRRFLRSADDETLAMLFHKWARVTQIPIDDAEPTQGHGETEAGNELGFVSPDGYYRFSPMIPEHAPAVRRLAEVFFHDHQERYLRTLRGALWEVPSAIEEEALHFRQSRLEEHGFPTWEEALSVYAPPAGARSHPTPPETATPDGLAAPRTPIRVSGAESWVAQAVDSLEDGARERVLHELVSLANHLLVADSSDTGDPSSHRHALSKAVGYVRIGLEARGARAHEAAMRAIHEIPSIELFREGYAVATALQAEARGLVRRAGTTLETLDRDSLRRLRALVEPRPLFLDLDAKEGAPELRDFRSLEEIERTRDALTRLTAQLPPAGSEP